MIQDQSSVPAPPAEERPCCCLGGWVYIGHLVERDGEEVEVVEAVNCKRCREDGR